MVRHSEWSRDRQILHELRFGYRLGARPRRTFNRALNIGRSPRLMMMGSVIGDKLSFHHEPRRTHARRWRRGRLGSRDRATSRQHETPK